MNNIYGNFVWWQGVVEDKMDPLMLGRCRVRILGYHTDDLNEIPTEDLPWAMPMQPTTSAAMSGVGTTPLGPVEGTWVVGFFRDGENAQEPIIMGTLGGKPDKAPDPSKGFNDPFGKYPLDTYVDSEEQDTNRLARGNLKMPLGTKNGENSQSLKNKRATRMRGVPKALAGSMTSTIPDTEEDFYKFQGNDNDGFGYWNEPNPRYGGTDDSDEIFNTSYSSCYPFNHVRQSESGHLEEWDDTPSAERMHRHHCTGTFEEIQPDGTRVTKIVGSDYEIVNFDKKVLINGDCDITIMGDARLQVQGSMVQEVYGNYYINVHGDMRTKITGNQTTEILSDRKTVINQNDDLFVAKNQVINIGVDAEYQIGNNFSIGVGKHWNVNAETISVCGTDSVAIIGIVTCDIMGATVGLASALLTKIQSDVKIWINSSTELINITGPIVETCAIKTSTAAGLWNSNAAYTQHNSAAAHSILAGGLLMAKAAMIKLN